MYFRKKNNPGTEKKRFSVAKGTKKNVNGTFQKHNFKIFAIKPLAWRLRTIQ